MNNACVLFSTVEKLTNLISQLAPELLSVDKCNEFAYFFKGKIDKTEYNFTVANSSTPRANVFKEKGTKLYVNI